MSRHACPDGSPSTMQALAIVAYLRPAGPVIRPQRRQFCREFGVPVHSHPSIPAADLLARAATRDGAK